MTDDRPRYRLYLIEETGPDTVLAEAPGSPFWSAIYQMALAWYGPSSIRYTFDEDSK